MWASQVKVPEQHGFVGDIGAACVSVSVDSAQNTALFGIEAARRYVYVLGLNLESARVLQMVSNSDRKPIHELHLLRK